MTTGEADAVPDDDAYDDEDELAEETERIGDQTRRIEASPTVGDEAPDRRGARAGARVRSPTQSDGRPIPDPDQSRTPTAEPGRTVQAAAPRRRKRR